MMKPMSLKTLLHNNNNAIGTETNWKIFPPSKKLNCSSWLTKFSFIKSCSFWIDKLKILKDWTLFNKNKISLLCHKKCLTIDKCSFANATYSYLFLFFIHLRFFLYKNRMFFWLFATIWMITLKHWVGIHKQRRPIYVSWSKVGSLLPRPIATSLFATPQGQALQPEFTRILLNSSALKIGIRMKS